MSSAEAEYNALAHSMQCTSNTRQVVHEINGNHPESPLSIALFCDSQSALKIREKTIIVWTTDNGSPVGQIGRMNDRFVRGGKMYLTENGLNAPFIVNCPGIVPSNVVTDALVDFTDLLPTFCELTNIELPDDYRPDGESFASIFEKVQ